MPVVFARIRVGDFDRWKAAFDSHEPYRREQGITLKAIYRDASYWNGILVILEADDVEKAQTYYSSDEQRQRMSQSGLERPAELWIGSEVLGIAVAAGLHFSKTVEAGGFVFVSGQLGFDAQGAMAEGVSRQTLCCLDNMAAALAERGLKLADVVKTTVWLRTDADFVAFNETYAKVFGDHKPARSTVVGAPARPDALIEIEAVAYRA